jgi:hypothetical protein
MVVVDLQGCKVLKDGEWIYKFTDVQIHWASDKVNPTQPLNSSCKFICQIEYKFNVYHQEVIY